MSISVVLPAFNGEAELQKCLVAPVEIMVVADGSTDGSVAVAARHGARVLPTDGRNGPARARNLGARAALGGVLFFLDADVVEQADAVGRFAGTFFLRIAGSTRLTRARQLRISS